MKYREHLSIVFMRDKGRRYSFRVPSSLFYSLLCCIVSMPLLVCGLGWFSWHIWQENKLMQENVLHFEDDFRKAQNTAERLENIEELLNESAVAGRDVLLRRLAASSVPVSRPDTREENGGDTQAVTEAVSTRQDVFPAIYTDYIRMDNVQARILPENKLRIAFDLRNTDNQKIAAGRVSAKLLTADGAQHELLFSPSNVGDFRISRFKRTVMLAKLSAQLTFVNSQVILEVHKEDGAVVFRDIYAVER